ncbi:MAG: NYN domain-containing protein [Deltaproteobacteria bacterium]|nr:MAG: NYN domain-containing protein [Deltaproteobacteria bacterium]
MDKRVCIFVDGENFRYSIEELFRGEFDKRDYLPRNASWGKLFDWIVSEATDDGKRLRTYWYVIQFIDFCPYKFPHSISNTEGLKKLLSKHPPLKGELDKIGDQNALIKRMEEIISDFISDRNKMTKRFSGWNTIQDGISQRHHSIEFRKAGAIVYNLFDRTLGKEKAVDVKLATDLISLVNIYDMAVIVSGDQDYVPVVQAVKDCGEKVVNVAFLTRSGQLLPGGARRLNQVTDWSLQISYDQFKTFLNL